MGVGVVMTEGSFTVTAAEASAGKDVDCGFLPSYVKVVNANAINTEGMVFEKFGSMPDFTTLETYRILNNNGDNTTTPQVKTSGGLSDYSANAVSQVETTLTGTLFTRTIDSTILTGTGSAFTTEVSVGDRVRVGDEFLEVASITSDTVLNTTSDWRDDTSASTATVTVPGAEVSQTGFKGFTIPASFIPAAGDVIYYHALGTQFEG